MICLFFKFIYSYNFVGLKDSIKATVGCLPPTDWNTLTGSSAHQLSQWCHIWLADPIKVQMLGFPNHDCYFKALNCYKYVVMTAQCFRA